MKMKILWMFILVSVFFVGCSGGGSENGRSSTKNIFGEDGRQPITTRDYPWSTIGKLFDANCTGTLVAKDLVLTAAHCVIDESTQEVRSDITSFKVNLVSGEAPAEAGISHVWWGTNNPNNFRHSDWAILRLKEALGEKYGWLGIRRTTVETFPSELTVAGYSADYDNGQTATVHHNCATRNRFVDQGFVLHDCDSTRGASGGPALRMYNNELSIYGIHVAERRYDSDTSLHIDEYDDEYGNIVIPSTGFLDKVMEILASDK